MSGSQVWIRPISVRLLAVMRNNSDFTTRIFGNSNGHHIDYCHIVRGTLGYLLAWLSNSGNIYYRQFLDIAPIVCGKVYVTVRCPSVCLSVPAIDRCSSVRRVCFCGPGGQDIQCIYRLLHGRRPAARHRSSRAHNSTAVGSKSDRCHVYSRRKRLNTIVSQ